MHTIQKLSVIALLLAASQGFAAQRNMEDALLSLDAAKDSLKKATADKGGYKEKALRAIDEAAAHVRSGIEYDRKNWSPNEGKKK